MDAQSVEGFSRATYMASFIVIILIATRIRFLMRRKPTLLSVSTGAVLPRAADATVAQLWSWNVWLIPFVSPNLLSRGSRIRSHCDDMLTAGQSGSKDGDVGSLVVVAMQEAWAFRAGLAWPLLWLIGSIERCLRLNTGAHQVRVRGRTRLQEAFAANSLVSLVAQVAAAVIATLLPWLPLIGTTLWDTKAHIANGAHRVGSKSTTDRSACDRSAGAGAGSSAGIGGPVLRWAVGLDGASMPSYRRQPLPGMDSGLLLLASHEPQAWGFEPYIDRRGETMANKGVLWSYWQGGGGAARKDSSSAKTPSSDSHVGRSSDTELVASAGTIVLTTHTTAVGSGDGSGAALPSSSLYKQIRQLGALSRKLRAQFEDRTERFEMFLAGDFNAQLHTPALRELCSACELVPLPPPPGCEAPSNFEQSARIDHILVTDAGAERYAARTKAINVNASTLPQSQAPQYSEISDHALLRVCFGGV